MPSTTDSRSRSARRGTSSGTRTSSEASPSIVPTASWARPEPGWPTRSRTSTAGIIATALGLVEQRRWRLLGLAQVLLGGRGGSAEPLAPHLDLVEGLRDPARGGLGLLQDVAERDLELRQLRVDVVLGLTLHRVRAILGVLEDPLGLLLGPLGHLLLEGHAPLLLAGGLDDPVALGPRLGHEVLPVAHDPPRLLDLLGEALLHLLEHLEDIVAADQHRGGQRHRLRLADELLQLGQLAGQVHQAAPRRSIRALRTCSGTRPSTLPPSRATSLTREDDRNDHLGLVDMNRVSTSPNRWFICAIWISYS